MPVLKFIIETDERGAVTGVMRYREALAGLGPAAAGASAQTSTAFDRIEATLNKAKSAMIGFVAAVAFAKVIQGLYEVASAAALFEDQFSNVKKTVEGTPEQFDRLSESLKRMSLTLPTSLKDLTDIATVAGQLGISVNDISAFTETIAKLGVTTGVSANELATAFGTIASVTGLTGDKFETFASVLTRLGNEFNATESQILHFATELAGTANTFKVSQEKLLALSTAFASVGLRAESSGSSLRKVFTAMSNAAEQGGEKLAIFNKIAAKSGEFTGDFSNLIKTDMAEAFRIFIEGFGKMNVSGGKAVNILKDLGLGNERVVQLVTQTAGGFEKLNQSMVSAGKEWGKTDAITREVGEKMKTVVAQAELLRNGLELLAIELSGHFLGSISNGIKALSDFTQELLDQDSTIRRTSVAAFNVFGTSMELLVTNRFKDLMSIFNLFPTSSQTVLKVLQILSTGFVKMAEDVDSVLHRLTVLVQALAMVAKGPLGVIEAFKLLKREMESGTEKASAAEKVYNEFDKIIKQVGKTGKLTAQDLARIAEENPVNNFNVLAGGVNRVGDAVDGLGDSANNTAKIFKAQVDSMLKSLTKEKEETAALVEVLMRAGAAGVKWEIITRTFSKAIQEAAKHTEGLTDAQKEVIRVANMQVEAEAKIARQQEILDDNAKNVNKTFLAQSVLLDNMNYAYDKWQQLLHTVGADLQEYNRIMVRVSEIEKEFEERKKALNLRTQEQIDLQNTLRGLIVPAGMQLGGVGGLNPDAKPTAEEIEKAGKGVIDQITNDISRMFKNAIGHGKSFWEAFKTMGMGAIASVADIMFKDILHGFLDQFKDKFGKWQLDFQKWVKDTLVPNLEKVFKSLTSTRGLALTAAGAGIGAAVSGGSKAGTVAGGLAGAAVNQAMSNNWIAAAILGIGAVGAAFVGMIHQLHQEANKFVQGIQNPFTQAVDDIFKGLTAAKDMGTLTVKQVTEAKTQFESMWAAFQDQAASAGVVGQQALQTMTPFVDSWREWLGSLETAASNMERLAQVKDITDKVTKAADGWDILEIAIQDMMDRGMEWGPIIKFLGDDITDMADKMRAFGLTIPPAMQSILDAMDAMDKMQKAVERQKEVEEELAQVHDQLVNALISKLDYLDSEIGKGQDNIAKYRDKIEDLNESIKDASSQLADASYWRDEYNKLVQDEARSLQDVIDKRRAMEDRIGSLEERVQRDRLETALINARASKNQNAIDKAEAAIDSFDNQVRLKEMAEREQELRSLKSQLPELIRQQGEAQIAFFGAAAAANAEIASRKSLLSQQIDGWKTEKSSLETNIRLEEARIEVLKKDRTETEAMLTMLGGKRQTELEKMNATIEGLITRGQELERERDALAQLTGIAKESVDAFHNLGRAIQEAANMQVAAPTIAQPQMTIGPAPTPLFPEGPTNPGGIPTVPNGYISTDGMDIFGAMFNTGAIPSFEGGTQDTGPKPLLALLHPHEAVLTKEQNGGINYSPSIIINNMTVTGDNKDSMKRAVRDVIIPEILSALDTNSSQIVQKFNRKVAPTSPKLINK